MLLNVFDTFGFLCFVLNHLSFGIGIIRVFFRRDFATDFFLSFFNYWWYCRYIAVLWHWESLPAPLHCVLEISIACYGPRSLWAVVWQSSVTESDSVTLGYTSVFLWMVVEIPQLITNYWEKCSEGLYCFLVDMDNRVNWSFFKMLHYCSVICFNPRLWIQSCSCLSVLYFSIWTSNVHVRITGHTVFL